MNTDIISEFERIVNLYENIIQYLTETETETETQNVKNITRTLELNKLTYKLYRIKKTLTIIKEYPLKITHVEELNRIKGIITPLTINMINQILTNGMINDIGISKEVIDCFGLEKIIDKTAILRQPSINDEIKRPVNVDYDDTQSLFGFGFGFDSCKNISDVVIKALNCFY